MRVHRRAHDWMREGELRSRDEDRRACERVGGLRGRTLIEARKRGDVGDRRAVAEHGKCLGDSDAIGGGCFPELKGERDTARCCCTYGSGLLCHWSCLPQGKLAQQLDDVEGDATGRLQASLDERRDGLLPEHDTHEFRYRGGG